MDNLLKLATTTSNRACNKALELQDSIRSMDDHGLYKLKLIIGREIIQAHRHNRSSASRTCEKTQRSFLAQNYLRTPRQNPRLILGQGQASVTSRGLHRACFEGSLLDDSTSAESHSLRDD